MIDKKVFFLSHIISEHTPLYDGEKSIILKQFLGQLPHSAVIKYLQESDIYVSTSKSDGTSLSLLEAMACGAFPVVTDIPANREWINNGVNGFLVSIDNPFALSDKIYEVFLNKNLKDAAHIINVALVREKASLHKNLGKVEGLYLELLKSKQQHNYIKDVI